jgi:hypothetical protein
MDTKVINLTIIETGSSVLFVTCNTCGCIIEYEFGMTYNEAILDVFKKHSHKLKD